MTMDIGQFLRSPDFSACGSIASVISLLLTIWVLIDVRKIRSYYRFTARVPELVDKLGKATSQLSALRDNFENSLPQIQLQLGDVEVWLNSLMSKLGRQQKQTVKHLLKTMKKYDLNSTEQKNKDVLWTIYVELSKVLAEVKELQKDQIWER